MRPSLAAVACLLLAPAWAPAARAADVPPVAPRQEIVQLLKAHDVRDAPRADGTLVASVAARRPITRGPTVLPVLADRLDDRGRSTWIRVRLPGRALGAEAPPRSGWIRTSHTLRSSTAWHIVVRLRSRRVAVYREGRLLRTYRAIVGKAATPTPTGTYFVEENVRMNAGHPGAPFALATSARSRVLQEFAGGPGQIALHGLRHVGGQLGTAVSHGCVRLADSAISWLAGRLRPGVPITIVQRRTARLISSQ